jgi:glycosyltransferase involved in cell wall biosynthesis
LREQVRFTGKIAPSEVAEHLATSDIFITASYSEGRPNSVLEAMAGALPVVATRIDAINEIINEGQQGRLFEPGDSAALAKILQELIADPDLRHRLGNAARQFIIDHGLRWEATAAHYLDIYRQVLRRDGRSAH